MGERFKGVVRGARRFEDVYFRPRRACNDVIEADRSWSSISLNTFRNTVRHLQGRTHLYVNLHACLPPRLFSAATPV